MLDELEGKPTLDWWKDGVEHTLRVDYPLTPDSTFVDIGGHGGNWSEIMFNRYGSNVLLFEPIPEFFHQCQDKFKDNPKFKLFNFALSDHDGEAPISVNGVDSSLFKFYDKQVTVPLRDVADVFKDVPEVELVSINCEGAEFVILPRLVETGLISRFNHVQVQFHELYPDARNKRRQIQEMLLRTHTVSYNYQFVWESWRKR